MNHHKVITRVAAASAAHTQSEADRAIASLLLLVMKKRLVIRRGDNCYPRFPFFSSFSASLELKNKIVQKQAMGSCCCCCFKRKRKMSDPVAALSKRPLIEVHITEPLIPSHSLAQIHRCYHHSPDDTCKKPQATVILSNWFSNLNNVFIALHDFMPQEEGDLRLVRGEVVEVVDSSSNWWIVRKSNGQDEGVVPSNYLGHVFLRTWFYGKITRDESESTLKSRKRGEENFLIRESETRSNYLTLSIKLNEDESVPYNSAQSNSVTSGSEPSDGEKEVSVNGQSEPNQIDEPDDQVTVSLINKDYPKNNDGHNEEERRKSATSGARMCSVIKHYLIHCTVNGIFYIHPEVSFNSLDDLVIYYSKQKHCLCCKLIVSDQIN